MKCCEDATSRLCDRSSQVSSHYIINKVTGEIIQLVENNNIAYHAGDSYWRGKERLNEISIGIELDNNGEEEFSAPLMQSLLILLEDLTKLYSIEQKNILGHLDVSPIRKDDPHHKFNWKLLSENGFGLYPHIYSDNFNVCNEEPKTRLENFGYNCKDIKSSIIAFNRHFNPAACAQNMVDFWLESSNLYLNNLIEQIKA